MKTNKRYSPIERKRAVRLVFEQQHQHSSQWSAIESISSKIGCTPETLRSWVRQSETGAFGQVTASSLLLLPVVIIVGSPWTLSMPGMNTWLSIVALGIGSTALSYVLYFRILATAGATNIALVTLLVPISAIMLGWLILGETLLTNHLVGMVIITFGLLAVDGRLWAGRKVVDNISVIKHPINP